MEDLEKRRRRERRDRDRDGGRERRRSEREKSSDSDREKEKVKHRDRDRERRRSEREKSSDSDREKEKEKEKHRDRDRERRRSGREKSSDLDREKEKKKHRSRERRRSEREKSSDSDRENEKEKEKHRDRDRERLRTEREKSSDSDRENGKEKEKHRFRERSRSEREKSSDSDGEKEKHRDRDRERSRSEREKSSDSDGEKEKHRVRDRERRRSEREKSSDSDRENEKEKHRDRDRERRRSEREKEKEKERERAKEKEREKREREKERERAKEKEREKREREKERERKLREREKRKEHNSDDSKEEKERHRKRRRREHEGEDDGGHDDHKERESKLNRGESPARKKSDQEEKTKKSREEEMEDEQRKLDEEMEKRRRRVQEWQELKRKKEESEMEKNAVEEEEGKIGKAWTLDGESDDEANMDVDENENEDENENPRPDSKETGDPMIEDEKDKMVVEQNGGGNGVVAEDEDEIDPLDAFMNSFVLPEVEKVSNVVVEPPPSDKNGNLKNDKNDKKDALSNVGQQVKKGLNKALGRIIPGEDSDSDYGDVESDAENTEDEDDDEFMKRVKKTKAEKLSLVDHSKIDYIPFRKNFYIEVKEISRMTPEEVAAYRKEMELKLHGKDVPKPIKTWHQTGLTSKILETIRKLNYEKPMSIQAQAVPIIMSGRDCIGIAKTGSGKTLAFVLPMLRHIKDQPPVVAGDGPIGLIMAPTRELVQQIHSDIRKFTKAMGIRCVPVYGGSGVAQQISELKRGTEIVVCTPGRMIDILCTSAGKISNLRRVTYLVLDEADRMFDMGFEPQITRIVQNIRPDRQTVLFSATFPRQVEILARKVLNKPIEVQVGGRSVVNKDITQLVEMRPESDRFLRLLELLGEWYEKGKILIFVQSQEKCDALFRDLLKHGYPCLSLHGAKDQTDRESTISDFKTNVCNLLIATSIAARGLDVKDLELVINFDVPNHYEDYVHRVGRTGRAGKKGCAITFISEDDARYAPDLLKALELSEQVVPDDLKALADGFMAKVNQGLEQAHGTGYGGSGFKFNEEEDEKRKAVKKAQAKEYGFEEDKSDSEDEDAGVRKAGGDISQQTALAQIAAMAAASKASTASMQNPLSAAQQLLPNAVLPISLPGVLGVSMPGTAAVVPGSGLPGLPNEEAARKAALQAAFNLQHNLAKIQADVMPEHYEAELEINEFPQNARWKVTHKETLGPISEWTGAAITTRGQFFPPGRIPGPGERKLYLFIEGPTEISVKRAKAELKRVLEDISHQSLQLPGGTQPGRYQVL